MPELSKWTRWEANAVNRTIPMVSLVMLCASLNGCASYWYQEGRTFAECQQAQEACREELIKRSSLSRFGSYEIGFMKNCMEEKGYRRVRQRDLPMGVRRQAPETSLHYRAIGVAGELSESK